MTIEIIHEPAHYNPRCGCMIPEAWTALIPDEHKWPCGSTHEEAATNVRREYPNATIA